MKKKLSVKNHRMLFDTSDDSHCYCLFIDSKSNDLYLKTKVIREDKDYIFRYHLDRSPEGWIFERNEQININGHELPQEDYVTVADETYPEAIQFLFKKIIAELESDDRFKVKISRVKNLLQQIEKEFLLEKAA